MRKASQVTFQALVHSLRLTICFRMIGRAHLEFTAQLAEQFLPELAGENGITVGDHHFGLPVEFEDMIHIGGGYCGGCKQVSQRDEQRIARELVHHDHDTIGCAGSGEAFHEIHRDHCPCLFWDREWLQQAGVVDTFRLRLLANSAGLNM
jgi:hypothetical protein